MKTKTYGTEIFIDYTIHDVLWNAQAQRREVIPGGDRRVRQTGEVARVICRAIRENLPISAPEIPTGRYIPQCGITVHDYCDIHID